MRLPWLLRTAASFQLLSSVVISTEASSVATGSFDEARALDFAKLAGAAGCPRASLESWSCGYKCSVPVTDVRVCGGEPLQAYVARWGQRCIMSFEGTHDLPSFLEDLRAHQHPVHWPQCQECMVHKGFLSAYEGVKPCMIEALHEIGCDKEGVELSSTGWSLGGAVSNVAMLDLKQSGWRVTESYDFGKPRVGNSNFSAAIAQAFPGSAWRVTHAYDPVPHLPLQAWSYADMAYEAFYPGDVSSGHVVCEGAGDRRCSAQHGDLVKDLLHVWDHFVYMDVRQGKANCTGAALGLDDKPLAAKAQIRLGALGQYRPGFTTVSEPFWCALSLLCSVTLWGLYATKPRLRHTPGWLILRASVCEAIPSVCFLIVCALGGSEVCVEYKGSTLRAIWILYLIIAASEVTAYTWRLTMFFNLVSIYRNPFKPERHRTLYMAFSVFVAAITTVTIGLSFRHDDTLRACEADPARRDYLRVLFYGFYVLPFIIFVLIGGLLFSSVKCLVAWADRVDGRGGSHAGISSLSRQRVFSHGIRYLLMNGIFLAAGLALIIIDLLVDKGGDMMIMREVLTALTCGRPCFSFVGWIIINNLAYEVCGWTCPRWCRDDSMRHTTSTSTHPFLEEGGGGITTGVSAEDPLRIQRRHSSTTMQSAQGIGIGFKRELRLELLLDVVESISEIAKSPPEQPPDAGALQISESSSIVDHCIWRRRPKPPCYEAEKFRCIRHHFGCNDRSYAAAFPNNSQDLGEGWQQRLLESVSEGASGSFFYRVINNTAAEPISNFIVKQICEAEKDLLMRILDPYLEHVTRRSGRSLIQYLGCHSIDLRWKWSGKVYFVVMKNILPVQPWLVFDLKGATANRRALQARRLWESNIGGAARYGTLRDWEWMDIAMTVDISDHDKASIDEMIRHDAEFLARQRLLDYSLLIGIHRLDRRSGSSVKMGTQERDARLAALKEVGGYVSLDRQKVYFFGIIDILEKYDLRWKAQHAVLTAGYRLACKGPAADGITAMSPGDYADRFCTFVRQEVLQLPSSYIEPVFGIPAPRNFIESFQRCCRRRCLCCGDARRGTRNSRERWTHLWQRRRRGLVRERLDCEREHSRSRIRELQARIEELQEGALNKSTVPSSQPGTWVATATPVQDEQQHHEPPGSH